MTRRQHTCTRREYTCTRRAGSTLWRVPRASSVHTGTARCVRRALYGSYECDWYCAAQARNQTTNRTSLVQTGLQRLRTALISRTWEAMRRSCVSALKRRSDTRVCKFISAFRAAGRISPADPGTKRGVQYRGNSTGGPVAVQTYGLSVPQQAYGICQCQRKSTAWAVPVHKCGSTVPVQEYAECKRGVCQYQTLPQYNASSVPGISYHSRRPLAYFGTDFLCRLVPYQRSAPRTALCRTDLRPPSASLVPAYPLSVLRRGSIPALSTGWARSTRVGQ